MTDGQGFRGSIVLDSLGAEIGAADGVLVDPTSGAGEWLRIVLHDGSVALVPLVAVSVDAAGRLPLPFSVKTLRSAPASADPMDARSADALREHFGLDA